jgi:predicted phosphoribosyltransferase
MTLYKNRSHAGRKLAERLKNFVEQDDAGAPELPRGGVPVAEPDTCREIGNLVERVVCLFTPEPLHSVGKWYEDFSQTNDDEVRDYPEQVKAEEKA